MESRGTDGFLDRRFHRRFAHHHFIGRNRAALAVDAEPGRGIALRIEIDDQHALADGGQSRAEIDGGRRLADAAFLVGEDENPKIGG